MSGESVASESGRLYPDGAGCRGYRYGARSRMFFASKVTHGGVMLKALHIALAYLTVVGFILRAVWALSDSPLRQQKWVKIAPHVVDTLLLVMGVALAVQLSISPFAGWLAAKLVGLLAYIGFGVLTLRAPSRALQVVGLLGALASVGYIFAVAFTRQIWPL